MYTQTASNSFNQTVRGTPCPRCDDVTMPALLDDIRAVPDTPRTPVTMRVYMVLADDNVPKNTRPITTTIITAFDDVIVVSFILQVRTPPGDDTESIIIPLGVGNFQQDAVSPHGVIVKADVVAVGGCWCRMVAGVQAAAAPVAAAAADHAVRRGPGAVGAAGAVVSVQLGR